MKDNIILEKLLLENVGPFKKLELEFHKQLTVLIGNNGTGKSTIINTVASLWTIDYFISAIVNKWLSRTHFGTTNSNIQMTVKDSMNQPEISYEWPLESEGTLKSDSLFRTIDYKYPLIGMGSYRKFQKANLHGPTREDTVNKNDLLKKFSQRYHQEIDSSIQEWVVNRYFFSREEWGGKYKRELEFFTHQFNDLITEDFPVRFKTVSPLMDPVFETATGDTPFYQLSSGIQSICYMFYEIISGLSQYYPESENVFLEKGLVLIDEIEIHLHPEWQKVITSGLTKMFPNCQFIVTTHSPIILSHSQKDEEIIQLTIENGEIKSEYIDSVYGWKAEDIYRDIMGLESTRVGEVEREIDELEELLVEELDNGALDEVKSQRLNELSNKLNKILPEGDPIVALKKLSSLRKATGKKK